MAQTTAEESGTPELSIAIRQNISFDDDVFNIELLDSCAADGGNSDEEGEEIEIVHEGMMRSKLERMDHEDDFHVKEVTSGNIGFILSKKEGEFNDGDEEETDLFNSIPKPPDNWERPPPRVARAGGAAVEEPSFENVDNPGNWNDYIFRPVYEGGKYVRHELLTGCTPVPLDENGKRTAGGWEFFYDGWKSERPLESTRHGATPANLFPKERESTLDKNVLKGLGMACSRIFEQETGNCDALFFFQLVLPMCDPSKSGLRNDPRMGYYNKVLNFSNLYKYQSGAGSTYGHKVEELKLHECIRFDGCVVRDGVRGGGDGAIYRRWQTSNASSDPIVQNAMTLS